MRGYAGKVAFVDLTSGQVKKESFPERVYRSLLGGVGLGAKVLYERTRAGVDPLGPENMLGFLSGLLVGTATPMATKYMVVTKSPLYLYMGGRQFRGSFRFRAQGRRLRWDIFHWYCCKTNLRVYQ